MKSISLLASLTATFALCLSFGCSPKSDSTYGVAGSSSGGGGGEDAGASSGGSGNEAGSPDSGDAGDAGSSSNGGSAGDDSPGAGSGPVSGSCAALGDGVLLMGDPNDVALTDGPTKASQGILDTPPIRNEAIAVIGTKLFVETEQELWMSDLSAATRTLTRIAGKEGDAKINAGVSCADTRLLVVRDMVATKDGKLVLIDYVGGAVLEISDPGGPNCKSDWVAGTHVMSADPGPDYPLNAGDKDGPGAEALFGGDAKVTGVGGGGIHKVAVDGPGNIYTYDEGTRKVKKIATDAERTVSTVGQLKSGDDNVMGLAWLGGKLYLTGVDGTNDFLQAVDPSKYDAAKPTANVTDVFRNRGEQFPEVSGSGHQAGTAQIIADGDALIISGQIQYVWRVATDGTVLATLAGSDGPTGPGRIEFESDFDPTLPHPAKDWQLVSRLSGPDGGPWLALSSGKLYWSGSGLGKNYGLEFNCK